MIALFIFLSLYLHLIIHEIGHFFFGKLTGYDFLGFRIESHLFIKKDKKIIYRRFPRPLTQGQCFMIPHSNAFKLYLLGGILFNLGTSLITLALAHYSESPNLIIFTLTGILVSTLNGIPRQQKGIPNDGLIFLMAIKNPLVKHTLFFQCFIQEALFNHDLSEESFHLPHPLDLTNPWPTLRFLYAYEFLITEDIDKANAYLSTFEHLARAFTNSSEIAHERALIQAIQHKKKSLT